MNRKLISQLGDFHFTPTAAATANLLAEGVGRETIWETGNTVVDALEHMLPQLRRASSSDALKSVVPSLAGKEMILITCHRRESFGDDLRKICQAIRQLAGAHRDFDFVYPVHLNPNVQSTVKRELSSQSNVHLIPPQPYDTFLMLMDRAKFILTDSGGIQEEAYSMRKPILILRKHTERMEAVNVGYAWLVGCEPEHIVGQAEQVLADLGRGADFFTKPNPFGDGKASERIVDALDEALAK
jgi:UDP-N-acetylglucosamine 2-epimerase (non-hydrolysing)